MARQAAAQFFALTYSPHLLKTSYGYTLMTLRGLPEGILAKKIERITIDGAYHAFESLGEHAIILIPSFDQESQILQIYCYEEASHVQAASRHATSLKTISL